MEYLIRCNETDWFNLKRGDFATAFKPTSFKSTIIQGLDDHRIKVNGIDISFSYEDPGIQVVFKGAIEEKFANQIIDEILSNIEKVTDQTGRIMPL